MKKETSTIFAFLLFYTACAEARPCPQPSRPCIEKCLNSSINYGEYTSCRAGCLGKTKFPKEKSDSSTEESKNVF